MYMCVPMCEHHLVFAPEQIQASAVDGWADEVQAMVSNSEVQVAKAEHNPVWERLSFTLSAATTLPRYFSQHVCSWGYGLVVQDMGCVGEIKVLCLQDVLQLINTLESVGHVSCKVAVEEAHHVTIEGKTHGHASFITLTQINTVWIECNVSNF